MISIVVPAYNEEKNIKPLVSRLVPVIKQITKDYEIIIVDDGSTDSTWKEIKKLAKYKVRGIRRSGEHGPGLTIRAGLEAAKGDVVITMDSDLSHQPEELPVLYKKFREGYDVVIGSRFVKGGSVNLPKFRVFLSKSCGLIGSLFLLKKLNDMTSGYRIHKKGVLKKIRLKGRGFEIHAEVPVKAHLMGFRVGEAPINYMKRAEGKSKIKFLKLVRQNFFLIIRERAKKLALLDEYGDK